MGRRRSTVVIATLSLALLSTPAAAQIAPGVPLPVLVPLTGFVALEGNSQKNGVNLAERQIGDVRIQGRVLDTQSTPEAAVTAWERTVRTPLPPAVIGPILGTQMLALMPKAQQVGVPLLTISRTISA